MATDRHFVCASCGEEEWAGRLFDALRDRSHDELAPAWLPYWHIVTYSDGTTETKYGQWAPHMDCDILANLVNQARRAGFLA
jgi:hypothetical protein